MKRRILSSLMALVLVFGLLPATAFAEGEAASTAKTIYVDAINGDDTSGDGTDNAPYKTVKKAVIAAASGDTIQLGEGDYTLYDVKSKGQDSAQYTKNKDLTFVGQEEEVDKVNWYIGANPTPEGFNGEYDGDYCFDGAKTITFRNLTLRAGSKDYLGFIRADNTVVEDCTINGKTSYWGYTSATFTNTTFNCPPLNYAIWTYCSPVMTFDNCTFNSSGKVINVYNENSAADYTINFNNCTVNSSNPESLSVMNINDTLVKGFTINFTGTNKVTGIKADGIQSTDGSHASPAKGTANGNKTSEQATCSKLFEFNMKYGNGNNGKTIVNIDGETVWKDGKMVRHAIDTANDKYTDGYKDNAFTITPLGEWTNNGDGTESREVTKTCKYCGYETNDTETRYIAPIDWDVSRSKTATKLDKKTWTSDVTLSLPSAEEKLASDVVFVLDGSSSANTDVVKNSLALLESLKDSASDSGAAVNVCVVKFKRQAFKSDWYDLSKDFDDIKAAMETKYSGGTNIHAGLLAGKEALDRHTDVSASKKYLILVSDGSTYLYSKDGNWASDTPFTRSYYTKENYRSNAGGFSDNAMYEPNNYPKVNVARPKTTSDVAAWQAYLADVKARNETVNSEGKTGDDYDYHCNYDLNFNQGKPSDDFKSQPCEPRTANNRDMAFYYADQVWQEMKDAGYHLFSIATKDGSAGAGNADDSHSFMNYLNEGKSLDFNDIQKEILFAVSAGSTVTDTIGKKFTLYDVKSFTLKVGGTDVTGTVNGNTVNFGNPKSDGSYPYTVTYTPATKTFVWTINENVSNFAPVQLTYTVKLTKHETAPGTYGTEDLKGDLNLSDEDALFTNESAVLKAKNSAGVPVEEQKFPKPSVSYTISSGTGGDDGDDDKYFFAIQKVDAQDGHALNGAKFELYQRDNRGNKLPASRKTTAHWGTESGIALFSVSATKTSDGGSTWYYREITAPEGYVLDTKEYEISAKDFYYDDQSKAVAKAETVRNYRGTTPDLLNDSDHFAYVIGYKDGNVRPYGLISRAETTTIFFRLLKDSVRDGNLLTSNTYTDVADDYWANTAISTMTGLGIVQGRSTTTFDPKAPITRAQFAAICARFDTGKSNGEQTFSDIQGHWAEKYIERAAELGWIKGFEDGTFRPDTYITRAQAMTMINRVLNRIPEDESDLLPGMNVWPDCNPGDWFYLAVQEATNSHDFKHKAGNYETWTGMNKDPDWTRYER